MNGPRLRARGHTIHFLPSRMWLCFTHSSSIVKRVRQRVSFLLASLAVSIACLYMMSLPSLISSEGKFCLNHLNSASLKSFQTLVHSVCGAKHCAVSSS